MKDIDNSPKSAMALYVKMYCQKRGKTGNKQYNMIEATRSWVSLSPTDKERFSNLYKEYKTKERKIFASNLQNAKLYMKKRRFESNRLSIEKTTANEPTDADLPHKNGEIHNYTSYSICNDTDDHTECNTMEIQQDNHPGNDLCLLDDNNITVPTENVSCGQPVVLNSICEPTPPVRTSKELFEIIKNNEETTKNFNWSDLTKLQKTRYQRALLNIKKNYIKQYTAYLEQLTPEQLFLHYKSKC